MISTSTLRWDAGESEESMDGSISRLAESKDFRGTVLQSTQFRSMDYAHAGPFTESLRSLTISGSRRDFIELGSTMIASVLFTMWSRYFLKLPSTYAAVKRSKIFFTTSGAKFAELVSSCTPTPNSRISVHVQSRKFHSRRRKKIFFDHFTAPYTFT
jgi:hypothetical protein